MKDRNKTQLTHDVTKACTDWLDNHGFKPWETEVCVADRWIADIAAAIIPTQTELQNLKLLPRKPNWDARRHGSDWNREQYVSWNKWHRELSRLMTCVVEVKTSISDFVHDKKWARSIPSDLAYVVLPAGMVAKSLWPDGWGVLVYHAASRIVLCLRAPVVRSVGADVQASVLFQIGVRKDHTVRYAGYKERAQQDRIEDNERVSRTRVADALRLCLDVVKGEPVDRFGRPNSVESRLEAYRIRKIPQHLMEELQAAWGSGRKETI
jgi:hypothetical protein